MLRIIAGSARGIVLEAPRGRNTRPTLGSTRESIFNVLANVGIIDTRVLDIFAGTGALGLEALSRGATEAVFIDKATGSIIRKNAKKCHVEDKVKVLGGDVMRSLASLQGQTFDYLFMDPPYDRGLEKEVLSRLKASPLVTEETLLIVEASLETDFSYLEEFGYEVVKRKEYKTNVHMFLQRTKGADT